MTEWNAFAYDRLSALQAAMAEEILALLDLRGTQRILDIGCGNGRTTAEIAARVPHGTVVGIDASADMIAFANAHWTPAAHANLDFSIADARHLPFQREFDRIVSFNALHWVPEQALALRSIYSALKPGGLAQLRLVPKGERRSLEDVIEETRLSRRWQDHFKAFHDPYLHLTPDQYRELAEQNCLRVLSTQTADKAWDFQSRAAFQAFGSVTFVEWTRHLPEEERPAFITDVLNRYQHVAADGSGQKHFFRFYQMDVVLAPR